MVQSLLVTGGAGYVGSHFVKTFAETHPEVSLVVVDNLSLGHAEALENLPIQAFYQEDISNRSAMERILKEHRIEAVVHFAARAMVGESSQDPMLYFRVNTAHSFALFEAMQACNIKKLVFSSTCATYGEPDYLPLDETHPQRPINVYGLSKLMIEQALQTYAQYLGWGYVALRYFNASGADSSGTIGESHDPETHLIPLVLETANGKRPFLKLYGEDYPTPDGTCIRDYVHVTDLAEAHIAALHLLEKSPNTAEAVNLGSTFGYSVKEVVDLCRSVSGRDFEVKLFERREGDPPKLVANADKAFQLLGWKTRRDLKTIVEDAWRWETQRRY
jgi:UDP-glucose 4-epimerase